MYAPYLAQKSTTQHRKATLAQMSLILFSPFFPNFSPSSSVYIFGPLTNQLFHAHKHENTEKSKWPASEAAAVTPTYTTDTQSRSVEHCNLVWTVIIFAFSTLYTGSSQSVTKEDSKTRSTINSRRSSSSMSHRFHARDAKSTQKHTHSRIQSETQLCRFPLSVLAFSLIFWSFVWQ